MLFSCISFRGINHIRVNLYLATPFPLVPGILPLCGVKQSSRKNRYTADLSGATGIQLSVTAYFSPFHS
jgi:hypothetical protein